MVDQPKRTTGRVTLADVAAHAGVSRATASLVVRGSDLVAERTRERVRASIASLGYVYDRAAASLRTQLTHTAGLVVTDITNPFFAELAVSVQSQIEESGYAVLMSNTAERLDRQGTLLEAMHGYRVDGVLLCPAHGTEPETLSLLSDWKLPVVLVARYVPGGACDYVGADNELGAGMAVRHLAPRHRRIAFVGGPPDSSARTERHRGYVRALRDLRLSVEEGLSVESPPSRDGGFAAIGELLDLPQPPTAAVCYNDVVAFGVIMGLQARGLEVGTDFAVVGFDNIADSAVWHPPLTTISIPPSQIGKEAVALLLRRISEPGGDTSKTLLAPELIVRQSCGSR